MRSIRGAITVEENTKEAILSATSELLHDIIQSNQLKDHEIVAITFTATDDLDAAYPAVAAREQGIKEASLICVQEMNVVGSLRMCVRILMLVDRSAHQRTMRHSYLKGAKVLRPDLASFSIALDGPAGAGKSTIAKRIAEHLGAVYIDTGAMYRTLAYGCVIEDVDWNDESAVADVLNNVKIDIEYIDGLQHVFLDGADVSEVIRTGEIGLGASAVSVHRSVREHMVTAQQRLAASKNVIMDGRDIGTHVLPDADLKIYLTASSDERAKRRLADLAAQGSVVSFEEVKKDIEARDRADMSRDFAPLVQAEDAVVVDSSKLSIDETVEHILKLFNTRRD